MNQTVSNLKVVSTLTQMKQLTNQSNNESNNIIQLQNLYKNQIMKKNQNFCHTSGKISFDHFYQQHIVVQHILCHIEWNIILIAHSPMFL